MFAKTKKTAVKSRPSQVVKPQPLRPKSPSLTITEALKKQVFPHIVNDFATALKSLKPGESIRFGKLGMAALKKRGRPRKATTITATSVKMEKPTNGHLSLRESKRTIILS
ncbi:4582_t:CDS:2 [Scutellospora calospora]|uniref:4582_t:CDS:1 n=1 Tax=Scutellospora calospora TaxID=85575 RepID=A0ACA9JXQ6_9GLOM|nr:4582_t:CDS:2 [Scutellospora calospora]